MIPGERTDDPPRADKSGVRDAGPPEPSSRRDTGADDTALSASEAAQRVRREAWHGLDQGSVMSVELLTATLVWFGVGWLVDRLLGTTPWFMFAGALLGNWVGLYLLWVRGQRAEAAARAATANGHPPQGSAGSGPSSRSGQRPVGDGPARRPTRRPDVRPEQRAGQPEQRAGQPVEPAHPEQRAD